jgi:hypothetical protein
MKGIYMRNKWKILVVMALLAIPLLANSNASKSLMEKLADFVAPVVPDTASVTDKEVGMIVFDASTGQFTGLDAAGNWNAFNPGNTTTSEVTVDTGAGHGSTNNKIRRFVNPRKEQGTDIDYLDDEELGTTFTINASGVYAISYTDTWSAANNMSMGISINTSAPTTNILSVTYAQGKRAVTENVQTVPANVNWTGNLSAGDIVRAHTDGNPNATDSNAMITITRIR